jgi:hypothetical protein
MDIREVVHIVVRHFLLATLVLLGHLQLADPILDVQNVRLCPFASARGRHAAEGDRLHRGTSSGADAFF